jgi:PKD repeat protein
VSYEPDADYFGPDSFTYTISDGNGGSDTATVSITVTEVNDAPVAGDDSDTVAEDGSVSTGVLANDSKGPANESGQTLTVTLVSDPAHGSTSTNGTTVSYTPDANYNGPDSFTYTVCDDGTTDGAADPLCDTATVSMTVTEVNDAPDISSIVAGPESITENQSTTVTVTFQDTEAGQTHACVFTWSEGGPTTVSVAAGVTTCAGTHQYLDDNPSGTTSDTYFVGVTASDNGTTAGVPDPQSDSGSTSVQVNNAAPVANTVTGPAGPQAKGTSTTVSATYSDVGAQDTHVCTFAWDDGTSSMVAGSGGSCSATHTYTTAGVYSVAVTVTDDDTGSDTESSPLYVVIYDPGAGFVTGGGWINVTAGSCKLTTVCEGAIGKANFGFVAKYKKGATVPDGQTEFQFQAGNLNFHSEAYEWLVVSGNKAQYRGTGEINGVTGYGFLLTAYDQSPDKFRIKIWRISGGATVFDSRMGTSDDIDAANPQAIDGGSVVIHK